MDVSNCSKHNHDALEKLFFFFSPIPILIDQAPFHCHHLFDGIVLSLLNKLNTLNHQCDFTTELQKKKIR